MKYYQQFRKTSPNYNTQNNFTFILRRLELIFFSVLCVFLLATSKIDKDISEKISMKFVEISLPVVHFSALPFNVAINLVTDFKGLVEAKKENKILKEENDKLRSFYSTSLNIHSENKELRKTLKFITSKSSSYKVARIIGRSHQLFNQQLFIDAGKNKKIKEGSIVSGNKGVVGRISQVSDNKSRLILVNDASSRIPIITSKARVRGILAGNNSEVMEIMYLQKNHGIKKGDWVFTSGDGDTLPSGLLIGVVKKVDKYYASVEMIESVGNADFVTILDY